MYSLQKRKMYHTTKYTYQYKQWDVVLVDDNSQKVGSEQGGTRPALILAKQKNKYIVSFISSKIKKFRTHVPIKLMEESEIMLEQIDTISEEQIISKWNTIQNPDLRKKIYNIWRLSVGLKNQELKNKPTIQRGDILEIKNNKNLKEKVIVIQNDMGNTYSNTVIIMNNKDKTIHTISKKRILHKLGYITDFADINYYIKKIAL